MPDQKASFLYNENYEASLGNGLKTPYPFHLLPVVLLQRMVEGDGVLYPDSQALEQRQQFRSKRKGVMSMPPVLKRVKLITCHDVDHNGNCELRLPKPKLSRSLASPMRRCFRKLLGMAVQTVDFSPSDFLSRDEKNLISMIQTCEINHNREPIVRAAKLHAIQESFASNIESMKSLLQRKDSEADYPDLFCASLKKRKRTGTRTRHATAENVSAGLGSGFSLLFIDEASPQRGVRLRPIQRPSNPFLLTDNSKKSTARTVIDRSPLLTRSSLFSEMVEVEASSPTNVSRLKYTHPVAESRGERNVASRALREGCRSIPPIPRPKMACRSVPPKVRLCVQESPVVSKAGKWSVLGRVKGAIMFTTDNEIMACRIYLRTRYLPLRQRSASLNYS